PLAFKSARLRPGVLAWWGGSLVAIVSAVGVLAAGFGALNSPRSILGLPWAIVLALLVALAVFAALRALSLNHDRDSLPYRAGAYVFPIGVVDAQTAVVRVYRFPQLSDVTRRERRVSLTFEGGVHFEFDTADPALAEQLLQHVEQNRQRVSGDSGPPSSRELAALDPLADTGFKSPFTPTEPRRKSSPRWLRFGPVEAILAGAVLGPLLWKARNYVSEERLYIAARNLGTTSAFRTYLQRGGARPDVSQVLLPHAELQEAIAKNSVAGIEEFMARGKHEQIDVEVQAALKKALLAELTDVAAKNSLTLLQNFERDQPHHDLVQKELEQKRAELYQRVVRAFTAAAQPSTPGLVGIFGRLLFYAQKHGPEVEIAFRRRPVDSKDTETALTKSAYFITNDMRPSRYFRPEDWAKREAEVGGEIEARLNREFPPDVLHFKLVPAMDDDGTDAPKVTKPMLIITHRDELSGGFMSKKPRGIFVGLGLMVRSVLLIPSDDQPPLAFKFSAWLAPDLKKWEQPGTTPKDIYEALAKDGLSKYEKKQLAFLLKTP
ncbi:MAG TPA: hypothetical protein VNG33_22070, partial [Polyangiaceae bacterium]|nr:hypothetical protein [Polyangiaceae bacterium]